MIKQSDIAMIVLVVSISLLASFFIGNSIMKRSNARSASVEVILPISDNFVAPSTKVFNDKSINPTELIKIGSQNTEKPFAENN